MGIVDVAMDRKQVPVDSDLKMFVLGTTVYMYDYEQTYICLCYKHALCGDINKTIGKQKYIHNKE